MSMRLSEHASLTLTETADIGGTSANSGYLAMKSYARAMGYAELGTWNSTDDLDEAQFQQASSSTGTGVKDLTTSSDGGNYDTTAATGDILDADGDFVIIEIRGEDLDVDSSTPFNHIRMLVTEDDNTGVDNVTLIVTRYGYAYPQKELQGAAVLGSKVYVDVNSAAN